MHARLIIQSHLHCNIYWILLMDVQRVFVNELSQKYFYAKRKKKLIFLPLFFFFFFFINKCFQSTHLLDPYIFVLTINRIGKFRTQVHSIRRIGYSHLTQKSLRVTKTAVNDIDIYIDQGYYALLISCHAYVMVRYTKQYREILRKESVIHGSFFFF